MRADQATPPPRIRVLLVDDDQRFVENILMFLTEQYDVGIAMDANEALAQINRLHPDVVLLDIGLGRGATGFDVLRDIRTLVNPPQVIMLTEESDPHAIVQAIKAGAFHYVCKMPDMNELTNLINLAAAQGCTERRLTALEAEVERLGGTFLVRDEAMQRVVRRLERVAPTGATVLIIGETGTGKELAARHLHELSRRSAGPFIPVNCAAISESLLESELFGHVRGAFTGAARERAGLFQQAQGGTLFLDEIGHAPRGLQVRLLRVLETGEFVKVGGDLLERSDARIVAASSRDLKQAVEQGSFMEELLFRLAAYRIDLPPLRQRPGDILPLSQHFLRIFGDQIGRRDLEFSEDAKTYLLNCAWTGNVRRLRNTIERAVIDTRDRQISMQLLAARHSDWPSELPLYKEASQQALLRFKRDYLSAQLERTGGNVSDAAKLSGISRTSFSRMMNQVGL